MNQRVLITGASAGFGRALAEQYAQRGASVLATDIHDEAPAGSPGAGPEPNVHYRRLDVRKQEDWDDARDWVQQNWGGLDLLMNNAGVAIGGRIDMVPLKEWDWIVDINLMGVVRGCVTFVPMFKEQGTGHIANTASLAGLVHLPHMSAYNSVKAAVVALSESLAHELAADGIKVSAICPSFFRTTLSESLTGSDPEMSQVAVRLISGARLGADEVAARTIRKLDRGRYLILTHVEGRAIHRFKGVLPWLYQPSVTFVAGRVGEHMRKQAAKKAETTGPSADPVPADATVPGEPAAAQSRVAADG